MAYFKTQVQNRTTHYFQNTQLSDYQQTVLTGDSYNREAFKTSRNYSNYYDIVLKREQDNDDWAFGTRADDPEEYIKEVKTGISSRTDLIQRLNNAINENYNHNSNQKRRRRKKSEFDGDFNIDRGLAGEPDFYDLKTKVDSERGIDYYIMANVDSSFSPKEYERRIEKYVLKMANAITQGYQVRINSVYCVTNVAGEDEIFITTLLKDYNQLLDLHLMANIMQTPFYRCIQFSQCIRFLDSIEKNVNGTMGYPIRSNTQVLNFTSKLDIRNGFIFNPQTLEETDLTTKETKVID